MADDVIRLRIQHQADMADDERFLMLATIEEQEATIALERQAAALRVEIAKMKSLSGEADSIADVDRRITAANARLTNEVLPRVHALGGQLKEARRAGADPGPLLAQLREMIEAVPRLATGAEISAEAKGAPLTELFDAFAVRRLADDTLHQVIAQDRGTVRRFVELAGDRPAAGYQRGDITRFLDTLRQLPVTYGKSPRDKDLTLAALIARADAQGSPRVGDKTAKRHLSALSSLFQFAVDQGYLTVAARGELVDDHRFRSLEGARTQRDAWTSDELKALFGSPVWTGCNPYKRAEAGPEIIRDSKFWLPLLALFHGSRLEEFADLYGRDIIRDGDTWAVRLVESVIEGEDGPRRRRLKTSAATRIVPMHPEIVRLGFLEHARRIAPNDDDPLFPELKPQGRDGKRGPRVTRWFVEYRRAVNVFRPGIGMHAFRHLAITRLTDVITNEQQRRHRDFVMGHGATGSEGSIRYDKGPRLAAAAATLALLEYPELDLSHLYVLGSR